MAQTGTLLGKTLFITGASRGIGLAIAKRAAQDGANIVIIAKTAETNPKLPGTIYSAAAEIEVAGGRALPLAVDIREDQAVFDAVAKAVQTFGGIDILVNNASAISLTNTEATPMKRFDLMNGINARGTYLCTMACLAELKKSAAAARNPHVLTMSPPLSMKTHWFQSHTAYTMAKYGMSMCTLVPRAPQWRLSLSSAHPAHDPRSLECPAAVGPLIRAALPDLTASARRRRRRRRERSYASAPLRSIAKSTATYQ